MPLIIEPENHSPGWLVDQLKGLREELSRTHDMIARDATTRANPAAIELARGITAESVELADAILASPAASPKLLARAVNQLYEVRNGMPFLFRAANTPPAAFPSPPRRAAAAPVRVTREMAPEPAKPLAISVPA
jgi:hypothetical protein